MNLDMPGRIGFDRLCRLLRLARLGGAALALLAAVALVPVTPAHAQGGNTLEHIDFNSLPGNLVRISFQFSGPVDKPSVFKTENPARVALDFMGAKNGLKERDVDIGVGVVESVATVEAGNRTRAVLRLARLVPFETEVEGNTVRLTVHSSGGQMAQSTSQSAARSGGSGGMQSAAASRPAGGGGNTIEGIDFRRSEDGAGRVIVKLSDPSIPVNVEEEGGKIVAYFLNAQVPEKLQRRLDVTDFATPVSYVTTQQAGDRVRVEVTPTDKYEQLAYQAGDTFTIEVQPVKPEKAGGAAQKPKYTGERLSLNFQDIEVRSVLQLIADFTDLNIVVSDSVSGNITLRLQNVPWDQALDIILKTKGLAMRRTGNVIRVAPAQEIAEQERQALQAQQQQQELAPLHTSFLQVNYAKASNLANLIKNKGTSLLSERGSVTVDQRTNTLIVQDTDQNISDIRAMVTQLDIPVRQVLIESRVVIASNDFSHELGVQFGYSRNGSAGNNGYLVGGTQDGSFSYNGGQITGFEAPAGSGNEGLIVDLPTEATGASLGLAIGRIGSHLLQLELSAMETESRGDIISSPRVITANQTPASIEQGVEIPYQEASSSGATSVSFKKAVLGLTVTPQITPDDRILLDLEVSKDSRGQDTQAGPAINTQSVTTQVLVDNGETVVLGGIYERNKTNTVNRVPFFGELPFVGWMFRNNTKVDNNSELLIFVTPKILKESLALNK